VPPRTNEEQQLIEMVKRLLAPEGSRVTASRMLVDSQLKIEREVDVVVEHDFDGDTFVQSFEVTAKGRPADISWVEQIVSTCPRTACIWAIRRSSSGCTSACPFQCAKVRRLGRGGAWQLGTWLLNRPAIGTAMLENAHNNPEREQLKWFEWVRQYAPPICSGRHATSGSLLPKTF